METKQIDLQSKICNLDKTVIENQSSHDIAEATHVQPVINMVVYNVTEGKSLSENSGPITAESTEDKECKVLDKLRDCYMLQH